MRHARHRRKVGTSTPVLVGVLLVGALALGVLASGAVAGPGRTPAAKSAHPARRAGASAVAGARTVAAVTPQATPDPSTVLLVGPGDPYATPCQAIAAAQPGDTVEIDAAGTYTGDVCAWSTPDLTIEGINGTPVIDAGGANSQGKATWVVDGDNTTIENVRMINAAVPAADGGNGAAIRDESPDLTVVHCFFDNNQEGILTYSDPSANLVVDSSEFSNNGAGDGQTHNIYVGSISSFTMRYSWSHLADVGHLVKSRAATNHIEYNRLTGETGTDSYELDLPNGGLSYVIGNVIEKGPNSPNHSALVTYGEEGNLHPDSRLFAVNNTFVDQTGRATAVLVASAVTAPALIENSLADGPAAFTGPSGATLVTNCVTTAPLFTDPANYDYHLQAGSPCIGAGSTPSADVAPTEQYVYDLQHEARPTATDAGAFASGIPSS